MAWLLFRPQAWPKSWEGSSEIWELFENLHDALRLRQKPSGDAASGLRLVETECVGQVPPGAAM